MDICGLCGNTEANAETNLCSKCNGDYWIQPKDFTLSELKGYIKEAAKNLGITVQELKDKVCS